MQLESYRSASNRITFLYDNNGTVNFTAVSNTSENNQNFRFILDEGTECFYLTAKTQTGKYVYVNAKNSDANMKFSDVENPVPFIMHPLNNRKGYVHLIVNGYPLARIDFGAQPGFIPDTFN